MKFRFNHRFKLNNKGNTLGIVIIGIFILSILGTLILGLTATNYKMKLVDKKSEATFYYAEKAVDEIYAGIGTEVMTCAKKSYENVMENYLKNDGSGGATKLTKEEAKELFNQTYIEGKRNLVGDILIDGLNDLYPDSTMVLDNIQTIYNRLESKGYISGVTGYSFRLVNITSGTDTTSVEYVHDPSTGELEKVLLKNICVECETDSTGFYSSIITDFEIKVPDINLNFVDSPEDYNFDELFEYSIIAQGNTPDVVGTPQRDTIEISANNVTITGNVYAGTKNSNDSIVVGNGSNPSNLTVNAKNLVCEGPFVLKSPTVRDELTEPISSTATLRNLSGEEDSVDELDSLQFYAKDIRLEGDASKKDTVDFSVVGNCIISDDLEVNGNNYDIKIKGNYFGYGFQASGIGSTEEADSGTFSGFITPGTYENEHEKRSAIIINGKNANIDMTEVNEMILGGRAYIDLDSGGQYGNASYMTGESVSFKGNQQVYMADTALNGSKVQTNPISYADLKDSSSKYYLPGYTDGMEFGDIYYSQLGLNKDLVVAKKTNDKVYFYNKNLNAVSQTEYFINTYNNNATKRVNMRNHVAGTLGVRNVLFGTNLRAYTVGALMSVTAGNLNVLSYGPHGISKTDFLGLIDEIQVRKSHIVHTLKDISATNILKSGERSSETLSTETVTPYEYFMNTVIINNYTGRKEKQNVQGSGGNAAVRELIKTIFGYTDAQLNANVINVGYIIDNSGGTGTYSVAFDAGIIVTNQAITINKNFTGLIVCKDTVYISGGDVELKASKELVKCMFENIPELRNLLKVSLADVDSTDGVVSGDSITFEDLVEKYNWRKNTK